MVEYSNFEDTASTKISEAASEFARLIIVMRDNFHIQADFIASRISQRRKILDANINLQAL